MEQPHAHEGDEAHPHPHIVPQGPPPRPLDPTNVVHAGTPIIPPGAMPQAVEPQVMQVRQGVEQAIATGAQEWFAREFVGGLLALADARGVDRVDFMAERLMLASQRLATAESQVMVLTTQLQTATMEIGELRARLADCPCHDGDPDADAASEASTRNGDGVA